ncbi:unnamed protein product [Effrenium voratum]|uniref:EF-hand domain-containing protein n=1 Tax=Effrenium voratum TaxID=2562239 RepID=A0AA36N1I3_9DINO|nr:unnamed protein product [Effrenium voratum]CAJ1424804.1 unnamed protein product [Effrenium voratum]
MGSECVEASPLELAAVWVHKASKGSSQWVTSCPAWQLEVYRFRKRLKPVRVLVKFAFLSLAMFEEPLWRQRCPDCPASASWHLPRLSWKVSNTCEICFLLSFLYSFWLRERSLGAGSRRRSWHKIREVLVCLSLLDCLVACVNTAGVVPGEFRLCRLLRPVIFLTVSKDLQSTLGRLWRSCKSFWQVLAALGVCVLFFMWMAIVVFARSDEGLEHFKDWPDALASLWILFTTANFPDVMMPSYSDERESFFFFFLYLVVCLYLLNNILLASVYNAYKEQLKAQLKKYFEQKAESIQQAFELLSAANVVTEERWVDFFTAYCQTYLHFVFKKDYAFNRRQARRTFTALDADGNGFIERGEFCLVVEALSNESVYIPMRPVPSLARSGLGSHVLHFFIHGVRVRAFATPIYWRYILDLVTLLEAVLALVQTIIFVSPGGGGKFRDAPLRAQSIWFKLLTATTVFFGLQMVVQMLVMGPARYWNRRPYRNRFDFFSIFALLLLEICMMVSHEPHWMVRTVLALHISRLICLSNYITPFRYLVSLMARLAPVYHRTGLLLLMVYYIYATIGEQLFGGKMTRQNLQGTTYAASQYWALNFDDFPSGLVTLFSVMVVNNWFVIAGGFMAATSVYASLFFVSFFVLANLIVLNILLALIIDTALAVREEMESDDTEAAEESPAWKPSQGRETLLQRLLLNEDERTETHPLMVIHKGSSWPHAGLPTHRPDQSASSSSTTSEADDFDEKSDL